MGQTPWAVLDNMQAHRMCNRILADHPSRLPAVRAGAEISSTVIRDANFAGLERWQLIKLKAASQLGRRKVEVRPLCKELQLDRRVVLHWLKAMEAGLSEEASAEPCTGPYTSIPSPSLPERTTAAEQVQDRQFARPARKFSKATEDTLEMVFARNAVPDESIILSIVSLHHVPKRQVMDWFAERRRYSNGKGRKPQRQRREMKPG